MIAWSRPPFSLTDAAAAIADCRRALGVERLEAAFADAFDVPHAVLLPSARAGIGWALQAALQPGGTVLCPVFTCKVVHEAVVRSGTRLHLLDAIPGQFLLDADTLGSAVAGPHAVILSEMYGHPYDLPALARRAESAPTVRVVDMAMTVPSRALLERLAGTDFGVISFGVGKCLYAEWGGMGFTRDATLAAEVRRQRDACRSAGGRALAARRVLRILLRAAISDPDVYRFPRRLLEYVSPRPRAQRAAVPELARLWKPHGALPMAWRLPSTPVDRRFIQRHLAYSDSYTARRGVLAADYDARLQQVAGITLPPRSAFPLSHYTLRVHAPTRSLILSRLRRRGIAAGTLFEFPSYLRTEDFPHAAVLCAEVMNLPLSVDLTSSQLRYIATCVAEAVADVALPDRGQYPRAGRTSASGGSE